MRPSILHVATKQNCLKQSSSPPKQAHNYTSSTIATHTHKPPSTSNKQNVPFTTTATSASATRSAIHIQHIQIQQHCQWCRSSSIRCPCTYINRSLFGSFGSTVWNEQQQKPRWWSWSWGWSCSIIVRNIISVSFEIRYYFYFQYPTWSLDGRGDCER